MIAEGLEFEQSASEPEIWGTPPQRRSPTMEQGSVDNDNYERRKPESKGPYTAMKPRKRAISAALTEKRT
jgi:hypothetical protein